MEDFYLEYHGHRKEHLQTVIEFFKRQSKKQRFIYLAGDSSLDNKYWILGYKEDAVNGYEKILSPPEMVPDVCGQLNKLLV